MRGWQEDDRRHQWLGLAERRVIHVAHEPRNHDIFDGAVRRLIDDLDVGRRGHSLALAEGWASVTALGGRSRTQRDVTILPPRTLGG